MQHCGICSVLAALFRRIMCMGENQRGNSDYYEGLDEGTRGVVTIEHTNDHGIVIHVVDPVAPATCTRKLSDSDWLLLETLDKRCQRPLHTRRFLTMHKRRRKKLTTRLLTLEPALLDDIQHGQVQCVLDRVWQWPFNAFTLDTVTGGRSLPVLCVHLFHWYGLLDHFNLDVVRVWKLFTLVEEGYHSTNPYHNSIHATDVTQAMHCFLQEDKIQKHLTPLEIMSSLIAAVTHDLDHPGVNQPFLIATSNHLAALYENTSVLENHHWRSAIGCLLESRVAEQLGPSKCELEHQISSLILATDITRQQEFLTRFKRYLDQSLLDMHRVNDRHFILQIALKCADICNPCRPWEVSRKWSLKVCEEFFRQGDYERQLNLPVTSLCDRQTTSVPKIQVGFLRFVVSPLFEEWHRFLGTKLSHLMMKHLRVNQERWESMVEKENAEETHTEVSDADVLDEEVESTSEDEAQENISGSMEKLLPSLPAHQTSVICSDEAKLLQRVGRRHSVPLSVPQPPPFAQTIIRRESLPTGDSKGKRHVSSIVALETSDEQKEHGSSLSLASSCSGNGLQNSRRNNQENRPVSTENLLPEPSIASITTSLEASRLSSVLHGVSSCIPRSVLAPSQVGPSRYLTRQQTFPPLQQFVRIRYMSTTADMANCSDPLPGIGSQSNSSVSSHVELVSGVPSRRGSGQLSDSQSSLENTACKNGCGTPTGRPRALQSSNRTSADQLFQCTSSCSVESDKDTNVRFMCKKEPTEQSEMLRDKGPNSSRMCDTSLQHVSGKVMTNDDFGKENVDPRNSSSDVDQDNSSGSKTNLLQRNAHQGLVQRRGSAPVGLLSRSDDNGGPTNLPLRGEGDRFLRRGSVPIDITRQRNKDGGDNHSNDLVPGRNNLLALNPRMPECCLPPASTQQHYVHARRSSAPVESNLNSNRLDGNIVSQTVNNGHVKNNRRIFCRHNSGGLEGYYSSDRDKGGGTLSCR